MRELDKSRGELYCCGDIHGELETLVWNLTERYGLENCSVIVLGDFGVGFSKSPEEGLKVLYNKIEDKLNKKNITLYAIRGNHDDPKFFDGTVCFPRLNLLKDGILKEIEGFLVYPIGGATSIDQEERKNQNKDWEKYGSSRRCWWENERPDRDIVFPNYADVIVSHTAPMSFRPVISRPNSMSLDIFNSDREDREFLDEALKKIRCSRWYFGHFHKTTMGSFNGLIYRGLDIMELIRVYDIGNYYK